MDGALPPFRRLAMVVAGMLNCFVASQNDSVWVRTASTADLMQASWLLLVEELLSVGESSVGEFMDDMVSGGLVDT